MKGNLKTIFIMGLVTILLFPLIAYLLIDNYLDKDFLSIFATKSNYLSEIAMGLAYGFFTAKIGWWMINMDFMKPVQRKYGNVVGMLKLNFPQIIFLSICAGVGEEILFRGAIQDFWGVWFTSIFFVAIHGYLNPMDWRISIYGAYMTINIAGIGFMTYNYGLTSAMIAHAMIDVVLLYHLTHHVSPPSRSIVDKMDPFDLNNDEGDNLDEDQE